MEIKPGAYKTRGGKKAIVVACHPNDLITYILTGYIIDEESEWLTWSSEGRFNTASEGGLDLIEEWKEIQGWVAMTKDNKVVKFCQTKEEAEWAASFDSSWVCYVSGTEGVEP